MLPHSPHTAFIFFSSVEKKKKKRRFYPSGPRGKKKQKKTGHKKKLKINRRTGETSICTCEWPESYWISLLSCLGLPFPLWPGSTFCWARRPSQLHLLSHPKAWLVPRLVVCLSMATSVCFTSESLGLPPAIRKQQTQPGSHGWVPQIKLSLLS